ncbi:o-succinylbenzoate synthase [Nocardioides lentus]|uniref:o-succinylbenzoate synthase n=1 Tax=Nocardioides lentus TaxID=338077 RepID=A0ABP5ATS6_9ACTN
MTEPDDLHVWSLPMRVRFRGLTLREGVLLRGEAGWGEWSPFVEYDAAEAAAWLRCAREAAAGDWPAPVRDRVPVNVTVPAVDPRAARALVLAGGCTTAKVKVAEPGGDLDADADRVAAVREALTEVAGDGAATHVRVDANGAWDVEEAVDALARLDRAAGGLEYAEQPCAAVEDLARVRRRTWVPIAADESIRRAADPYRVRELEAADVAVLKVQPLGGVRACLRVAEEIGLPVVVSSAVESSVGLAAGVALAAALPDLPHACGLGTATLLGDDVLDPPARPVDGSLPVTLLAGAALGPEPDALARTAAPADREAWWRRRHDEVAALLDGRP